MGKGLQKRDFGLFDRLRYYFGFKKFLKISATDLDALPGLLIYFLKKLEALSVCCLRNDVSNRIFFIYFSQSLMLEIETTAPA